MQLDAGLPQRFADRMGQLLGPDFPTDIGLAVSGGGDSMAMLHLAAGWARVYGVKLWVVTIDHSLRPESAAEAQLVADECAGLDLPHVTMRWDGWDGQGNLQDAARSARRDLISKWRGSLEHVLFAHTQDDQAETFLMRLTRGSGVDGLAGMSAVQMVRTDAVADPLADPNAPPIPRHPSSHWKILRPLLEVSRAALRHHNTVLKIPFVDDASNDDPAFTRVRMRQFLADEGLDQARLLQTQASLSRAREALERRAFDVASVVAVPSGVPDILALDRDNFEKIEKETQLRILSAMLQSVAGNPYRPRFAPLDALLERILSGGRSTLHGAMVIPKGARLYVGREYGAVCDLEAEVGSDQRWDSIYRIYDMKFKGLKVKALGDAGLPQITGRPDTEVPRDLLKALHSIWKGDRLVACLGLGFGKPYVAERRAGAKAFPDNLLTH